MRAEKATVRQFVTAIAGFDLVGGGRCRRLQPPHGAARQKDIVAVAIGEVPEIAEQIARAFMDEEK